ncbi:MAG TPA: NAD(P)-binding domain-containing protein, partial [Burkholderiales bacterium]|nr:NAD(P)-binding domain-containing protein [Burkholderiales bacterium]
MIGFIGLGVMGEAMCRNLGRKASEDVLGFDLDPSPLARLKDEGVDAVGSVREIAEQCNIVFLSLPGVPEVKNVCAGPSSLMLH